jgi:hypothetical protein
MVADARNYNRQFSRGLSKDWVEGVLFTYLHARVPGVRNRMPRSTLQPVWTTLPDPVQHKRT